MSKNQNPDPNKVNQFIKTASQKLGTDPETLKQAAKNGDVSKALNNLNPEDAKKIQHILSDKEATSKLLSSPQAQQLFKKFLEGK